MENLENSKRRVKEAKAYLFDFDGTLVNLDDLNLNSFKKVFKQEFEIDFTKQDFMNYVSGRGSVDGITDFLTSKGIQDYNVEEIDRKFDEIKDDLLRNDTPNQVYLLPGLEDFLLTLINTQKPLIVVTSSKKEYVNFVLSFFRISEYFEKIFDRNDVINSKPHPEMFLKAIEYTGFTVDECIAFEDSLFGLQSAKSAGLFTVGLLNKGWNDDIVYKYGDIVIDDYRSLIS
jgi:beta-phosphoglucomutase